MNTQGILHEYGNTSLKRWLSLIASVVPIFILTVSIMSEAKAESFERPVRSSVTLEGWLTVIWGDDIHSAETSIEFFLTTEDGRMIALDIGLEILQSAGGIQRISGRRVIVVGKWGAKATESSTVDKLIVSSIDLDEQYLQADALSSSAVVGPQPWVSILCKFADEPAEPEPLSFFLNMYANEFPGLDHYWRELSYDEITLEGSTAVGWYTLPQPGSYYRRDLDGDGNADFDWTGLAIDCTSAADADVYFPDFAGINLMLNAGFVFGWWGGSIWLDIDGVWQEWMMTWISADLFGGYRVLRIIEHEMGHGFGLPHSGAYGDVDNFWDVMGIGRGIEHPVYGELGLHTIAYHKDILGWIPGERKLQVDPGQSVTVTLERLALPQTENILMLKIPIGDSGTRFYTLEARSQVGYDEEVLGDAVVIHSVDTSNWVAAHVVDSDGDATTYDDQMWTAGETFTDEIYNISVFVEEETATGYIVTVTVGEPPPDFTSCGTQTQILEIECEALIALYNSTSGNAWNNNTGWLEYPGPCDWYGVTCIAGQVQGIAFGSNNLDGFIPPTIGSLLHLEDLYLFNNQLTGNIPPELGNLSSLEYLYLDDNELSGNIPIELSALSNLVCLKLAGNNLSGSIPDYLGDLSKLTSLNLSRNQLSGNIPLVIGSLPVLSTLNLSENNLEGEIPSEIGDLSRLIHLDLSSNQLTGEIPPDLKYAGDESLAGMSEINLGNNLLSGTIPPEFGEFPDLNRLNLSSNHLSGNIPNELGNNTQLQELELQMNALEGEIPSSITALDKLNAYPWSNADFGFNMLIATDPGLISFLNEIDPDWAEAQTVPPMNLQAIEPLANSVRLTWNPIPYQSDGGSYQVLYSTSAGGPYAPHGTTMDKSANSYVASGLLPNTTYYLVVRTFTPAHNNQKNDLWSNYSQEVSATTTAPSMWYLAEGYTGQGFGTYILIQNPNDSSATVDVTYMLQGGGTLNRQHTVPANSRYTIVAQEPAEVGPDQAFSTKLSSDLPIIVERAMYFPTGGHDTIGVTNPASTWYLAEGYTGSGFGTYILVQNPNDSAATVDVTYMLQGGGILNRQHTVLANSRYTIVAQDPAEVGPDQAFSTKLSSDLPIIVERAMYFANGGHDTIGVTNPASTWYLAEGYTGQGFGTYILIQNPNDSTATVDVTYMLQGGGTLTRQHTVPANSRYTIVAQDATEVGPDQAFSTKLSSNLPIIVERAMYFANGGHDTIGVTDPANTWYLAEGYTGDGFGTYILIQNPNDSTATVDVTYMLQGGGTLTRQHSVPANSRYTIVAQDANEVGPDQAFSTKLSSNLPIIVERAMYFPTGGHDTIGVTLPPT